MEIENKSEVKKEKSRHPLVDKLGILSMFFASIFLIYQSVPPLIENLPGKMDQTIIINNLIILILGIGVLYSVFAFYRRLIFIEYAINSGFEQVIYPRLEPILGEVASVQVEMDELKDNMQMMNLNIDQLRKSITPLRSIDPDISSPNVMSLMRIVVLANISTAAFLFLLQYTKGYVPYVLTIMYILWWLEITYEFDLWKNSKAWTWLFPPIIMIPTLSILIDIIYGGDVLIALTALGLVLYSFAYFTWCMYKVQKALPFDLHLRLREIKNKRLKIQNK
jgi:hypothetical protein